jgi:hypothetical protein
LDEAAASDVIGREPLSAVMARHGGWLMAIPGVVGIGEAHRGPEVCLTVFVREPTPTVVQLIPERLDGYDVQVVRTGEVSPL